MSMIVGGIFTSHVPGIGDAIANGMQQDPYWKPFFDGFDPVHGFLAAEMPDVAVVFFNDHELNFRLDMMPTFAIGAAAEYCREDEGPGAVFDRSYIGHQALSWHILEHVVESEFDPVICKSMMVDRALAIPFELCWPGAAPFPVKVVPIAINTVQHPLPSPKRCFELGKAVGRAIESFASEERVVVFGTGGLSYQPEGEHAGQINASYDKFCLRNIAPDPEALLQHDTLDIVELAGSQGVEILNWIAARGAMRGSVRELASNYHVPNATTATATVLLENRMKVSA
jgi:protocatechuate 4,5-dioxygenase, beta chain